MSLTELTDWYERQNQILRQLLWSAHPCDGKYGDDGELQCNECLIDFKRHTAEEIEKLIVLGGLRKLGRKILETAS
jgi:hypothetical protein